MADQTLSWEMPCGGRECGKAAAELLSSRGRAPENEIRLKCRRRRVYKGVAR